MRLEGGREGLDGKKMSLGVCCRKVDEGVTGLNRMGWNELSRCVRRGAHEARYTTLRTVESRNDRGSWVSADS
jgi:hypothetical protein